MTPEFFALALLAATPWIAPALARASGAIHRLADWLLGLAVVRVALDDDALVSLAGYLNETSRRLPLLSRPSYSLDFEPLKSRDGARSWLLSRNGDDLGSTFLVGRVPAWLSGHSGIVDQQVSNSSPGSLSYLRGTLDHEKLLVAAAAWRENDAPQANARPRRFRYYERYGSGVMNGGSDTDLPQNIEKITAQVAAVPVNYDLADVGFPSSPLAIERLALTAQTEALVEDVRFWKANESWFRDRGVPWTRKYLLKGPPGTGKTSLARAICEELDLPLWSLDVGSMNNREVAAYWSQATTDMPGAILLEDLDGVFSGRENVSGHPHGATFNALLQQLDGARPHSGLVVFITTNHPERLDPAIFGEDADAKPGEMPSRPSRIDRAFDFGVPERGEMTKIAARILKDEALVAEALAAGAGETPAQLQERCFRMALDGLFGRREKPVERRQRPARQDWESKLDRKCRSCDHKLAEHSTIKDDENCWVPGCGCAGFEN